MTAITGAFGIFENHLQKYFGWEQVDDIIGVLPFMEGRYVAIGVALYLTILRSRWPKKTDKAIKATGLAKNLILAHNIFLAVYSLLVFLETFPLLYGCIATYPSFRAVVRFTIYGNFVLIC
jgi:hypothetical protein